VLWKACLSEHLRELSYMATLAGNDFDVGISLEYLTGHMHGYNDGIKNLSKEVLKNI